MALPAPRISREAHTARRARIAAKLADDEALVVATHAEALHSHDVHHRFRPQSDFWYLTGFGEPHAVLVLLGGSGESHLFLSERNPKQEIWTGRRLGVERAKDELGVDHAHAIDTLGNKLRTITKGHTALTIAAHDPAVAEIIRNAVDQTGDGRSIVADARTIKDADEIAMLQAAADAGIAGHLAALPELRAGQNERHAEAAFLSAVRQAGSEGPGYPPIVGAGANAAVLHYIDNSAPIAAGDLVLMDAGCEWGHYNSDITRTVPADGAWTEQQLQLYGIVLAAQDAAIREVRPGNAFRAPHDAACRVLAEGLADLGWIDEADNKAALDPFYMHGTSHYLGLDVHDAGRMRDGDESRTLEPGMVLTVEPGLYLNPDYATLPTGTHPLGIRIENDIVVTKDGCHDLTGALPRDPDVLAGLVRG